MGIVDAEKITVLVAEDNLVNQKVVRRMLMKMGIDVLVVNDGLEALKTVQQEQVDLILMDINMPRMNGVEATREIQKILAEKTPPIYALSASVTENTLSQSIQAGMKGFLHKPVKIAELETCLRNVFIVNNASGTS